MIVKQIAYAATLSFFLSVFMSGAVQAATIDLDPSMQVMRTGEPASPARIDMPGLPPSVSELPEPEVFAMMVVGLILIGYRAGRDSSEKFK
jgi:hypothetical protein